MKFEIVGKIDSIEIIAVGKLIREYKRLTKFGPGSMEEAQRDFFNQTQW